MRAPVIHFAPPTGWMNDPNGLIHWAGRHHLFFQSNPVGMRLEHIRWGHASSSDLLSWVLHEDVLLPGEPGTQYDQDGCFSGCAIADGDAVSFLYTGVNGTAQLPCLARSRDAGLKRLEKFEGNPIIAARPLPDALVFRDHSVLNIDGRWHQAVGGGTAALGGVVYGYTGTSLDSWAYDQLILDASRCDIPGEVWECPDLFRTAGGDALIVSIMDSGIPFERTRPAVWYAVGTFESGRFEPTRTALLDQGDRFYAPQSYWTADGRRIMFGWVRTDLDPTVERYDTRGVISAPRELTVAGDLLLQQPARELRAARGPQPVATLAASGPRAVLRLPSACDALEIVVGNALVDRLDLSGGVCSTQARVPAPMVADTGAVVLFDCGIIEAFSGGAVRTSTDLAVPYVDEIVVHFAEGASNAQVTVWALNNPLGR